MCWGRDWDSISYEELLGKQRVELEDPCNDCFWMDLRAAQLCISCTDIGFPRKAPKIQTQASPGHPPEVKSKKGSRGSNTGFGTKQGKLLRQLELTFTTSKMGTIPHAFRMYLEIIQA